MPLFKLLYKFFPLTRNKIDASDLAFKIEVEKIAKDVSPLEIKEEMDWGEPSGKTGKNFTSKKTQALADLQAILDSIPRPYAGPKRTYHEYPRASDADRAVLVSMGHAEEAVPASSSSENAGIVRQALIDEAMGNWAKGHDVLSRIDPKIRKKIQGLADQMLP